MAPFLTKVFFGLTYIWLIGAALAQSSSCLPMFQESYDFQVGDLFQRTFENVPGFSRVSKKTILKISIVSKKRNGDSLLYRVNGIALDIHFDANTETNRSIRAIDSTLIYPDAVSNLANRCLDSIDGQWITKIRMITGDKTLFPLSKDTSRLKEIETSIIDSDQKWVFAAGLGLVSMSGFSMGSQNRETLVGYVKNGDTVGVIATEAELTGGVPTQISPWQRKLGRTDNFLIWPKLRCYVDALGRRLTRTKSSK